MTARYHIVVTSPAQADSRAIQSYLVEHVSPDKADDWEHVLLNDFLPMLSKFPHQKTVREATIQFPLAVRQILYRPTKRGVAYTVLFTVEEFVRPNPEPTTDYLAGIVRVITIRPASMEPLTEEEIDARR
jgi:hypothetical protein